MEPRPVGGKIGKSDPPRRPANGCEDIGGLNSEAWHETLRWRLGAGGLAAAERSEGSLYRPPADPR